MIFRQFQVLISISTAAASQELMTGTGDQRETSESDEDDTQHKSDEEKDTKENIEEEPSFVMGGN